MSFELTHIGEAVVKKLIEFQPRRFFELCFLPIMEISGGQVFQEVSLLPYAGHRFDGASRVDLVVPISPSEALPVEVKLGKAGLSKRLVDTKWLSGCKSSHKGSAWSGNMMSILERRFPAGTPSDQLAVMVGDIHYRLSATWFIVVRRCVANAWREEGRPEFHRAKLVTFEDLVEGITPLEFDEMVRELTAFQYHQVWIEGGIVRHETQQGDIHIERTQT